MIVHTDYLWFHTKQRREIVRITDEVAAIVNTSGVREGMVLVSAMHITAGVYVNDWEGGLIHDIQEWLEKLAPVGPRLSPSPDRRRQRRRAPEADRDRPPGDAADHERLAGPRTVGAGVLRRVRRPAPEARRRESDGAVTASGGGASEAGAAPSGREYPSRPIVGVGRRGVRRRARAAHQAPLRAAGRSVEPARRGRWKWARRWLRASPAR